MTSIQILACTKCNHRTWTFNYEPPQIPLAACRHEWDQVGGLEVYPPQTPDLDIRGNIVAEPRQDGLEPNAFIFDEMSDPAYKAAINEYVETLERQLGISIPRPTVTTREFMEAWERPKREQMQRYMTAYMTAMREAMEPWRKARCDESVARYGYCRRCYTADFDSDPQPNRWPCLSEATCDHGSSLTGFCPYCSFLPDLDQQQPSPDLNLGLTDQPSPEPAHYHTWVRKTRDSSWGMPDIVYWCNGCGTEATPDQVAALSKTTRQQAEQEAEQ